MKSACLACLNILSPASSSRHFRTFSERVTDESTESIQKSSVAIVFSLMIMHPFGVNPSIHFWKNVTKSASVKCPKTHWHQMTSYLPVSGTKFCSPSLNNTPTEVIGRPFSVKYSLAFCVKFVSCSTKSILVKNLLSKCFVTRPMPAPQSSARLRPGDGFSLKISPRNCWELWMSVGAITANPPNIPSMVGGMFDQYFWAFS